MSCLWRQGTGSHRSLPALTVIVRELKWISKLPAETLTCNGKVRLRNHRGPISLTDSELHIALYCSTNTLWVPTLDFNRKHKLKCRQVTCEVTWRCKLSIKDHCGVVWREAHWSRHAVLRASTFSSAPIYYCWVGEEVRRYRPFWLFKGNLKNIFCIKCLDF